MYGCVCNPAVCALCQQERWCTPPSSSLRRSKHHVTAQHILDTLQHHVGLVLQAPIFAMQVQQGQTNCRTHTGHHTTTRPCGSSSGVPGRQAEQQLNSKAGSRRWQRIKGCTDMIIKQPLQIPQPAPAAGA
jgi:hypothetical protein